MTQLISNNHANGLLDGNKTSPVALTDTEDFSATDRAHALGGRFAVFKSDFLGVLDFSLGAALNAIGFHSTDSLDCRSSPISSCIDAFLSSYFKLQAPKSKAMKI